MSDAPPTPLRNLVFVLGDQLDAESTVFEGFDSEHDAVWMAEVAHEASHVWSAKARIAIFLAAMWHFRDVLRERGWCVVYHKVGGHDGEPAGGEWNYDASNRESFGKDGPGELPSPRRFETDAITREVLALVYERFADHPGSLDAFDWPITAEQARQARCDFIDHRLACFGRYQDAMWTTTRGCRRR